MRLLYLPQKETVKLLIDLGWGGLGLENPYCQHALINDRGNFYICLYFMIINLLNRFTSKVFHPGLLQIRGMIGKVHALLFVLTMD